MIVILDIATHAKRAGDTIDLPDADAEALLAGGLAHLPPAPPLAAATEPEAETPKARGGRTGKVDVFVDPADDPTPEP